MGALAGISGDVWFSTSPSTALGSPEACTDSGDHTHYFANTHRSWDEFQAFTVQCSPDGTTWSTVTDYEMWWPVGEIVFATARVVGTNDHVRISAGSYFTLTTVSGAHAWKAHAKAATKDTTPFQASGSWAQYTTTVKSATFSVDCFSQDARVLNEMIKGVGAINVSNGVVVCSLYWDKPNGKSWWLYALPSGVDTTVAAQDIDKQTVNMQATGPVYLVTSNTFNTTTVTRM